MADGPDTAGTRARDPAGHPPPPAGRGVSFRREQAADRAFLRRLYGLGRADELAALPWPAAMTQAFLDGQFAAQCRHFDALPAAERWLAVARGCPVGRLYLDRTGPDWRLLEIAFLPEHRGRGQATRLLGWMQQQAPAIVLHVARDNGRAAALYRRLGFAEVGGSPAATHIRMRWERPAVSRG